MVILGRTFCDFKIFFHKSHIFAKQVLEKITQGMEVADNMKSKLIRNIIKKKYGLCKRRILVPWLPLKSIFRIHGKLLLWLGRVQLQCVEGSTRCHIHLFCHFTSFSLHFVCLTPTSGFSSIACSKSNLVSFFFPLQFLLYKEILFLTKPVLIRIITAFSFYPFSYFYIYFYCRKLLPNMYGVIYNIILWIFCLIHCSVSTALLYATDPLLCKMLC